MTSEKQKPTVTGEGERPRVDVSERAGHHTGRPQQLDTRLFMQLWVFRVGPAEPPVEMVGRLGQALRAAAVPAVVYEDVSDPRGIGLLTWSEDPADFVCRVRPLLASDALAALELRSDFTMLGRTYSTGYEPDLGYWLLRRPVETVLNEEWPWAVWYPLRRTGAFAQLPPREQAAILKEHAEIGRAYGEQDLAHDVRLACHGLDAHDNEFVIGLIGRELHPLSHVVQAMRKTRQTAEYIAQMGPFFIGRAVLRSR